MFQCIFCLVMLYMDVLYVYCIHIYVRIYVYLYVCIYDPIQKRMTFLHFFTSFQNLIFHEILWLTPRKKFTHQK